MSLDDRVRDACHRIEELYYETGGKCYVSFSGGKDSTVLLALIKLCEEIYTIPEGAIPAVFSNTGIELGVTVDFVRWVKDNYYPNVQIIRPEKSFDWVIKNKGKPVKSKIKSKCLDQWQRGNITDALFSLMVLKKTLSGNPARRMSIADKDMHLLHPDFDIRASYKCCDYMKKAPFKKYESDQGMKGAISGVRVVEGGARSIAAHNRSTHGGKFCTWTKGNMTMKAPIIDWSDDDVEMFVDLYDVPLSDAYTKYGFYRTGCMACPYAVNIATDLSYLYHHEPNRYKAAMHWLKDVYIAQDVRLPFDEAYEREREREWALRYEPMRQEMLRKYRPNSKLIKETEQLSLFSQK